MIDAYLFDAIRTPRGKGKPDGSLYEVRAVSLLVPLLEALSQRLQLDTSAIDDCFIGCVSPLGDQGGNIAKAALLYAGWHESVSGMQINRFCGSGLDAVNLAAMKVRSGWGEMIVAGGIESMSRVPMGSDEGALLLDPHVVNRTGYIPQGVAADLIATMQGFSREMLDTFAALSQQKAQYARDNGFFSRSVIPVRDVNGLIILEKDELIRPDTTALALGLLRPSFAAMGEAGFDHIALKRYPAIEQIHRLHTAGNSSAIADGAALILVGSAEKGKALGLRPRARVLSAANSGTDPTAMLLGLIPAARKALDFAGLQAEDIDLWEVNEAFAAIPLVFQQHFEIPDDRLNVNGGAIALGHPLGATGAMLLGTLLDELERRDLRRGLVTLCIGGGMGVATVVEIIY